jgi:hypothetical protein
MVGRPEPLITGCQRLDRIVAGEHAPVHAHLLNRLCDQGRDEVPGPCPVDLSQGGDFQNGVRARRPTARIPCRQTSSPSGRVRSGSPRCSTTTTTPGFSAATRMASGSCHGHTSRSKVSKPTISCPPPRIGEQVVPGDIRALRSGIKPRLLADPGHDAEFTMPAEQVIQIGRPQVGISHAGTTAAGDGSPLDSPRLRTARAVNGLSQCGIVQSANCKPGPRRLIAIQTSERQLRAEPGTLRAAASQLLRSLAAPSRQGSARRRAWSLVTLCH